MDAPHLVQAAPYYPADQEAWVRLEGGSRVRVVVHDDSAPVLVLVEAISELLLGAARCSGLVLRGVPGKQQEQPTLVEFWADVKIVEPSVRDHVAGMLYRIAAYALEAHDYRVVREELPSVIAH